LPVPLDEILDYAKRKVRELEESPGRRFEGRDQPPSQLAGQNRHLRAARGVRHFRRGEANLCGEAGKGGHWVNYRMGDLFSHSPRAKKKFKHTLTRKLLTRERRFRTISEVRDFSCLCTI